MVFYQLAGAAEVIGVDVGVCHGGDFEMVVRGDFQIAVHVAFGIDEDCLAGALAADEVGVLGERAVGDLLKEYGVMVSWRLSRVRSRRRRPFGSTAFWT